MSRFTLVGLLRARSAQEDQARRQLGMAQVRVTGAERALAERTTALAAAVGLPDADAPVFLAHIAARASLAAQVNQAIALRDVVAQDLVGARSGWLQARQDERAVERLAERHAQAQRVERLKKQQLASDDLSGARHHRGEEDS
jgi:flagellar FliJ protein